MAYPALVKMEEMDVRGKAQTAWTPVQVVEFMKKRREEGATIKQMHKEMLAKGIVKRDGAPYAENTLRSYIAKAMYPGIEKSGYERARHNTPVVDTESERKLELIRNILKLEVDPSAKMQFIQQILDNM